MTPPRTEMPSPHDRAIITRGMLAALSRGETGEIARIDQMLPTAADDEEVRGLQDERAYHQGRAKVYEELLKSIP